MKFANLTANDRSNGGVNKSRGMNIFISSCAVIVLAALLALLLQSDSDASGSAKYFTDTVGDVFDEIGRTEFIVSESLLETLGKYRDIAPRIGKPVFKGSSEIAESLLELADVASDAVTSIIAVGDGGKALFRLFRWQLREIIHIINNSKKNLDQEAIEDIRARITSVLRQTEQLNEQIKDAGLRLKTVSNKQTWTLKRLHNGQYESKRSLEGALERNQNFLQFLFGDAVERQLRRSELNEILPLIDAMIGAVSEMNYDIPRLQKKVYEFREAMKTLSSELMHSTAHKGITKITLEYLIDALHIAEEKYYISFRKRKTKD
ncbi:3261_t:CDS:2 [Paraglomus occultum]|uniref:3261_t:CDS:1 n=1 Tax=Paraglomus occultum TaxID=144539 RepID=A0A9N9AHU2_9GLOM|nr:3261_t:CDS:2 [Paraglomus occultum]